MFWPCWSKISCSVYVHCIYQLLMSYSDQQLLLKFSTGVPTYWKTIKSSQTLIDESWQPFTVKCHLIYGAEGLMLVEPTILFSLQCERLQSGSVHSACFPAVQYTQASLKLKVRCDSWPVITLLARIMWFIGSSYCSEQLTQAGSQIAMQKEFPRLSKVMRLAPSSGSHIELQVLQHWTAHFSPEPRDILGLMMKLNFYRPL